MRVMKKQKRSHRQQHPWPARRQALTINAEPEPHKTEPELPAAEASLRPVRLKSLFCVFRHVRRRRAAEQWTAGASGPRVFASDATTMPASGEHRGSALGGTLRMCFLGVDMSGDWPARGYLGSALPSLPPWETFHRIHRERHPGSQPRRVDSIEPPIRRQELGSVTWVWADLSSRRQRGQSINRSKGDATRSILCSISTHIAAGVSDLLIWGPRATCSALAPAPSVPVGIQPLLGGGGLSRGPTSSGAWKRASAAISVLVRQTRLTTA